MTSRGIFSSLVVALATMSCAPSPPMVREALLSSHPPAPATRGWVDSVLATMTLEQKVGQLMMIRMPGHFFNVKSEESVRLDHLVVQDHVGGLLALTGDVYAIASELNRLQRLSRIPLLVAGDYERGVAMRVRRATYTGEAMAIGATRDTTLAYRAGKATAEEARAIGVHQNFAPVADINSNPGNPVINTRSFGDDPGMVSDMVSAFVHGTNDGRAVSTAKHFPGHGDTETDSHIGLPVLNFDAARIDSLELSSFKRAINAGVQSVMMAHIAVPALDPAFQGPASLSPRLIDSLLIHRLGFQGLVVTDALEMQSVTRSYAPGDAAIRAFEAGADVLLNPADVHVAIDAIVRMVNSGSISEERLNRSVKKILALKQRLGLDRQRTVDLDRLSEAIASEAHLRLAKEIAQRSMTIVRNERHVLPLHLAENDHVEIIAIGDTPDALTEVNRSSSGATVEIFGEYFESQFRKRHAHVTCDGLSPASDVFEMDSVLMRAKRSGLIVVALCVKPHAGSGTIGIPANMSALVNSVQRLHVPVVVLSLGNPYLVSAFPRAEGLLCAYSDAEYPVEASVQAMFGEIPVSGRLPITISPSLKFGSGIDLPQEVLRIDDPFAVGCDPEKLNGVSDLVRSAIRDSAFPGAQLAIIKDGTLIFDRAFGCLTYERTSNLVTRNTRFDMASVTKVIATTAAVMKLVDKGQLSLDDSVSHYLPKFSGGKKTGITIRQLLLHQGGLPPFRKLWELSQTPAGALDTVYSTPLVAEPGDTTIYSDFSMIILGKVVEKISRKNLAVFVENEFFRPLGMIETGFTPDPTEWAHIAPTERDTTWRHTVVQGTVHDENAAFLGGVSGHAGLFSTASDLATFMQMVMNGGCYGGVRYLGDSTIRLFTESQGAGTDRALGWDLKSPKGSSAGNLFSPSSYGHTGFTGTSIWVDPVRRLCVIFLTNRVYPTRANQKIANVRPALHDAIVGAFIMAETDVEPMAAPLN